ncbi:KilA-N domain-containing protein [Pseudomonas sp. NPDC090203]|uniref:KilA-N domain-containing protein n=1 Tax=Pseudomonas sp. NPDC090203 TaxID=3364477 RepID=UPI003827A463
MLCGERKENTREWLSTKSAQELIGKLEMQLTGKAVNKVAGRYGGTYAVKQLV